MQHCDAKDATQKGLNTGDLYNWNRYSDIEAQGGDIDENEVMPESKFSTLQTSLQVTEMGNSVPFSLKLDNFSKHDVKEVIHKVLKNDANKAIEVKAHAQFNQTPLRVVGSGTGSVTLDDGGVATSTNTAEMQKGHIRAVVSVMKERNIPMFDSNSYYCIAQPSTYDTLRSDLEGVYKYVDQGFREIKNGEIGRFEGMRFLEQTQIPKGGAADSTTWSARNNVSDEWDSGVSDWAFFFGEDTVAEAIVIPEEIRGKIPTDFGRSKAVAWYAVNGFGLVHPDAKNARIVKWDSDS